MSRTDDLAALFAQARPVAGMTGATSVSPSTGMQLRQGTLLAWDPSTGEHVIDVGGTTVENIPILVAESLALSVGDVVGVITSGSSWFLFGRIATPGADAAFKVGTENINFDARDIDSSTTFYSDEEPSSPVTGDVWFDTNDGNKLYRYDGTAWVAAELGGSALAADAIDGRTITGSLVRTAASGERVEIGDNPDIGGTADNEIRFYTGEPVETFPGKITVASAVPGSAVLTLFGPDMVTDGGRIRLWTNDSSGSSVELAADAIDLFANVAINSGGLLDHTGDAAVSGALSVGGAVTAASLDLGAGSTINDVYVASGSGNTSGGTGLITINHTLGVVPSMIWVSAVNSTHFGAAGASTTTQTNLHFRNITAAGAVLPNGTAVTYNVLMIV